MSNTKVFWVIAILVLVGVGGYFAMQNRATDDASNLAGGTMPTGTEGEWNDTPMGENSGKKMAFSQLVAQGGSYECTVNQYVNETETKGKVYMSGGLIRGEYNTQVQGISVDSTLIVRDGYTYSWTSMAPKMGFKTKVVAESEVNENQGTAGSYSWNADQIGDYDCNDWVVDMTMFEIPSDIKFQAMNGNN